MSYAKDVRGFSMYPTYRASLALLSDDERGKLLMSLFDYDDGQDTSGNLPPAAQMAFAFITARMEQDKSLYRNRCEINRENAAKRWPVRRVSEGAPQGEESF